MQQQTVTSIQLQIANATHELNVREAAAGHLTGIPARQNQTAIHRLYDQLNHLHIQQFELGVN